MNFDSLYISSFNGVPIIQFGDTTVSGHNKKAENKCAGGKSGKSNKDIFGFSEKKGASKP